MFGYVVVNQPEMKFKDFGVYKSFYCGLCRELREKYGITGQISLTYDMTFVILLLSGLYEPKTKNYLSNRFVYILLAKDHLPKYQHTLTQLAYKRNIDEGEIIVNDEWFPMVPYNFPFL